MAARKPTGLKILMMHGFVQSGALFHAKTRAFEKALIKAFPSSTLHYADGPIELSPDDIPGYDAAQHTTEDARIESFAWWRRRDGTALYSGIDRCFAHVAATIRAHGPFDGVIGFSQGGCAGPLVASLLEPERKAAFDRARAQDPEQMAYPREFLLDPDGDGDELVQPPLKFCIAYSGFQAPLEHYRAFYEPKIKTPVLHFIGSLDTLVSEERSRKLVNACEEGDERTIVHPGGHFMPTTRAWLDKTLAFIEGSMNGSPVSVATEERAEDMDVPF